MAGATLTITRDETPEIVVELGLDASHTVWGAMMRARDFFAAEPAAVSIAMTRESLAAVWGAERAEEIFGALVTAKGNVIARRVACGIA